MLTDTELLAIGDEIETLIAGMNGPDVTVEELTDMSCDEMMAR